MLKKFFNSIVLFFQSMLPVKVKTEKFFINPYGSNPLFTDKLHDMLCVAGFGKDDRQYEKMRDSAMSNFIARCQSRSKRKHSGVWKTPIDISVLSISLTECTQDQQKKAAEETLKETELLIKKIENRRDYRKAVKKQLKNLAGIGLFVAIFASICCLLAVSFGNVFTNIFGSKIADTLLSLALCDAIAIAGMIWAFIAMQVELKKDFYIRYGFLWLLAISAQLAFILK